MSGMEVVGVVAAVPPLLKMVKLAGTTLGQLGSKTRIGKTTQGLNAQLDLLTEILACIERRHEARDISSSALESRLGPVLQNIQNEVSGLLEIANKVKGLKDGPTFITRVQLVLNGFEKNLRERGGRLDRMINVLQIFLEEKTAQANERFQIRKLLATSPTDFIPKKLDGTTEWIWTHDMFQRWAFQPASANTTSPASSQQYEDNIRKRVLIIHGVKGCGKSVLAASVVKDLKEKGFITLFFSFWASHNRETRADAMLRALLWQLLETLPDQAQVHYNTELMERKMELRSVSYLTTQLIAVCGEYTADIFCVVDGIDESTEDWNDPSDGAPVDTLRDILLSVPKLRLLLIGRRACLRLAIQRWPSYIELTRELIIDDLNKFIFAELGKCPNITDTETRDIIRQDLEAKSTVMFLWIKLVFQQLRSCFSSPEAKSALSQLPQELDREYYQLFTMLMKRLHGRSNNPSVGMTRAKGLLKAMTTAFRPLSITELRYIYEYTSTAVIPEGQVVKNLVSEDGIIDACGDFISIKDDHAYLGHTTIREFLLRPEAHWTEQEASITYFRLESPECHRDLGLACLRYLHDVQWDQNGSSEAVWVDNLFHQYPLLHYACSFTTSHLLDSNLSHKEASTYAMSFLRSGKFVFWVQLATFLASAQCSKAPLPLHFWDDTVNFWGTYSDLGAANQEVFNPLDNFMESIMTHSSFANRNDDHSFSSEGLGNSTDELGVAMKASIAAQKTQKPDSSNHSRSMASASRRSTAPNAQAAQRGLVRLSDSCRALGVRPFVRHLPAVNAILGKIDAFVDPLDVLIQAFIKGLKRASFLSIMTFGLIAEFSNKRSKALKIFKEGLARVEGRGDLQEALAVMKVAYFSEDLEEKQFLYGRAVEILEARNCNPLLDIYRAGAGSSQAWCLFRIGRVGEAMTKVKNSESLLLSQLKGPEKLQSRHGGFLRQWCYQRVMASNSFSQLQMEGADHIARLYSRGMLWERQIDFLDPFLKNLKDKDDPQYILLMRVSAIARWKLGNSDEAQALLAQAKNLLTDNHDGENCVSLIQRDIAYLHFFDGDLHNAFQEISTMDIASFIENWGVVNPKILCNFLCGFLNTYSAMGRRQEAARILKDSWTVTLHAFDKGIIANNDELVPVVRTMLKHGAYAISELYLRKMMLPRRLQRSKKPVLEEKMLREALAFTISRSKLGTEQIYEALRLYEECIELNIHTGAEWKNTRLHFGAGKCYAFAGKPIEAAEAFEKVAQGMGDDICGPTCIRKSLSCLVTALACLQKGCITGALEKLIVLLSRGRSMICRHLRTGFDDDILLLSSQMLADDVLRKSKGFEESQEYRDRALSTIHGRFSEIFEFPPVNQRLLNCWTATWAGECYVFLRRHTDVAKSDSGVLLSLFPFNLICTTQYSEGEEADLFFGVKQFL